MTSIAWKQTGFVRLLELCLGDPGCPSPWVHAGSITYFIFEWWTSIELCLSSPFPVVYPALDSITAWLVDCVGWTSWLLGLDELTPWVGWVDCIGWTSCLLGEAELTAWVGRVDCLGWTNWHRGLCELTAWFGRVVCLERPSCLPSCLHGLDELTAWVAWSYCVGRRVDSEGWTSWCVEAELTAWVGRAHSKSTNQRGGVDAKGWASWFCVLWIRRVDSIRIGWTDLLLGKLTL